MGQRVITHEEIDALDVSDARRAMMHRHLDDGLCPAVLWHGNGHQSATFCTLTGEHDVHEAEYGFTPWHAEWTGIEATTGYFDEPPKEP